VPALSRSVERQPQAAVEGSETRPASARIDHVRVERDRAVINGQGPADSDYSLVLQIGATGTAATWAARLGQDPPATGYTAFDGTLALAALDGPRLQFVVTRRGGSVAQYIDLASVPGLPRGRVVFRTVTPSPEADGSYVVADLVPESGPALPISVSVRPTREVTAVVVATPGFGPVVEKVIGTEDADDQGLVFFNLETDQACKPPFPLKLLPGQGPAFVELTSGLQRWIRGQGVDILLHLGDKNWDMMTLGTQKDFAGQLNEWETVSAARVVALFAAKDAEGLVRDDVPASSFSHGYGEGFGSVTAFRTRRNTIGIYQMEGVDSTTRHGVSLRYKLVRIPALETPVGGMQQMDR